MKKGTKPKSATAKRPVAAKPSRTVSSASAKTKSALRPKRTVVPKLLLEGDTSPVAAPSGPGHRFELGLPGTEVPKATVPMGPKELPEAYGTKKLYLLIRDPQCLYARWDLTHAQQRRYNALSRDRHLVLRVYRGETVSGRPIAEIHVHPESRNWFVHVGAAETPYVAVLGFYQRSGRWSQISTSNVVATPPDTVSEDTSYWCATLPADLRLDQLVEVVKHLARENRPLLEAIQRLREQGQFVLPMPGILETGQWTPEQEKALAQFISMDTVRRVWVGSLEITELVRRQLERAVSSMGGAWSWESAARVGGISSISSPLGGEVPSKGFWFNVNAELIIYGATEPGASVTIGGKGIRLRPDGSFSFRFALPDGGYDLPAIAVSADGTDQRAAALRFSRSTTYQGKVEMHPQDPRLKPPLAQHVD